MKTLREEREINVKSDLLIFLEKLSSFSENIYSDDKGFICNLSKDDLQGIINRYIEENSIKAKDKFYKYKLTNKEKSFIKLIKQSLRLSRENSILKFT